MSAYQVTFKVPSEVEPVVEKLHAKNDNQLQFSIRSRLSVLPSGTRVISKERLTL